AAAAAFGAAPLDHELGDDAVEGEVVVVALAREADEVVDGVRRELRIEIHHDRTAIGRDRDPVDLVRVGLRFGHLLCGHDGLLQGLDVVGEVGEVIAAGHLPALTACASAVRTSERIESFAGAVARYSCNATAPSQGLFSICDSSRPLKTYDAG